VIQRLVKITNVIKHDAINTDLENRFKKLEEKFQAAS
jgi:hypothetical protein